MINSNEVNWNPPIWKDINDAVVAEMGRVRIAQKVFPTIVFDTCPTEIPNDVIDFTDLSIQEGSTKPFVEIYQEFPLTTTQVCKESELHSCKTLAQMAAKTIALAEDTIIFQGHCGKLPAHVKADHVNSAREGLLGEANPNDSDDQDPNKVSVPIEVPRATGHKRGVLFGENIFSAVAGGIAKLTAKAQAQKFALFLPVKVFADTYLPPSDACLVTTAERIIPLVEGGFLETVALPQDRGLLVALAGNPTSLYVGREATIEFVRKEGSKFFFRVVERIQFVARDPRAFVLLKFDLCELESPAPASQTKAVYS